MVGPEKLNSSDALAFLKAVKIKYQDNPEVYDQFLQIMKDFKALRVDTSVVISRVKELFKGQQDLLLGFYIFLPTGYKITVLEDDQTPPKESPHFDDVHNFINKVKTRLEDEHAFKSFQNVLDTYKKENKSFAELYHEVAILFRDHQDLLGEFLHFLPKL